MKVPYNRTNGFYSTLITTLQS